MAVPEADHDDLLPLLLELCEELISHAGPTTHEEIDHRRTRLAGRHARARDTSALPNAAQ